MSGGEGSLENNGRAARVVALNARGGNARRSDEGARSAIWYGGEGEWLWMAGAETRVPSTEPVAPGFVDLRRFIGEQKKAGNAHPTGNGYKKYF